MKKVLFYTNIPAPYRVDFFNELGKYCELTVLFELSYSTERDDKWKEFEFKNFKGIIMKGSRIATATAFCPEIVKYLKADKYDEIVVTAISSPTAIVAVNWLKKHHISYIYEGDGGFVHKDNPLFYKIKKYIVSNAKYSFSTADVFDDYCVNYGAVKEEICRYPLSSIWNRDVLDTSITDEDKAALKAELGIKENKVIITVGQMIPRKGFDILLKASEVLSSDWGIYLVGGKPSLELSNIVDEMGLRNVHFIDFMAKESLWKYYRASDLFVLPTREDIWGLVVNEAMANGLAVVTTTKCIAGLEMVEDGVDGYLYNPEDIEGLKDLLVILSDESSDLNELGQHAINKAKNFTIEKMVEAHINKMEL